MRPIATQQSPTRFPLNEILGTGANVRLLRVLAKEVTGPISVSDAGDRAGLTEAGARRALARLARIGFVRRIGGGRSQQYAIREEGPLAESLMLLFDKEQDRYEELLSNLREIFQGLGEIQLAWMDSLPAGVGDPLEVGLMTDPSSLALLRREVRRRISEVEKRYDVIIEVHGFTRADAPRVSWPEATLLAGVPDSGTASPSAGPVSHADRDRRALVLHRAISDLLDENPSLVRRAEQHLERLLQEDQGSALAELQDWLALLQSYSLERLRDFLIATGPRAERLRQSSPFFAVLTAEERDRVLESLESEP